MRRVDTYQVTQERGLKIEMIQQVSCTLEDDIKSHLMKHTMNLQLVVASGVEAQTRLGLEEQLVTILFEQRVCIQHGDQTEDELAHDGRFVFGASQAARENGKEPALEAGLLQKYDTSIAIVVQ